jgi:two-component system nitrate/nitrite response regulator NarL
MRSQIRNLLEPFIDIVAETADGLETTAAVEAHAPDLVILDVSMPVMNGIEAAREIWKKSGSVKIIFVSLDESEETASAALTAGGVAYIPKSKLKQLLTEKVKNVLGFS